MRSFLLQDNIEWRVTLLSFWLLGRHWNMPTAPLKESKTQFWISSVSNFLTLAYNRLLSDSSAKWTHIYLCDSSVKWTYIYLSGFSIKWTAVYLSGICVKGTCVCLSSFSIEQTCACLSDSSIKWICVNKTY